MICVSVCPWLPLPLWPLFPCSLHYHLEWNHSSHLRRFFSVSQAYLTPLNTTFRALFCSVCTGWYACLSLCSKKMQILGHPPQLCMLGTAQWWPAGVESIVFSACWALQPQDSLNFHQWPGWPLSPRHIHPCAGHVPQCVARNRACGTDSPPSFQLASQCPPFSLTS